MVAQLANKLDEVAMTNSKVGRVVWHDLFTPDESASKQFYEHVAGWSYLVEHATEFAWGGGERDFILALLDGEAGAGLLTQSEVKFHGWVPYVEVKDVYRSTQLAIDLGGAVAKPPFDVPGVGSNCLLRDPLGAHIGLAVSEHDYPIPTKQFAPERYLIGNDGFPGDFYDQMFGWHLRSGDITAASPSKIMFEEGVVAFCAADQTGSGSKAAWLPVVRVGNLAKALHQVELCDGSVLNSSTPTSDTENSVLARDPTELLFFLARA
jgi:predicted enzyme related to lactoylglutathione lyase